MHFCWSLDRVVICKRHMYDVCLLGNDEGTQRGSFRSSHQPALLVPAQEVPWARPQPGAQSSSLEVAMAWLSSSTQFAGMTPRNWLLPLPSKSLPILFSTVIISFLGTQSAQLRACLHQPQLNDTFLIERAVRCHITLKGIGELMITVELVLVYLKGVLRRRPQ